MVSSTFERFGRADCELEAIQWAEGGRDLLLTVQVQSAGDEPAVRRVVRCSWIDDVDIKLVQGRENNQANRCRGLHP